MRDSFHEGRRVFTERALLIGMLYMNPAGER